VKKERIKGIQIREIATKVAEKSKVEDRKSRKEVYNELGGRRIWLQEASMYLSKRRRDQREENKDKKSRRKDKKEERSQTRKDDGEGKNPK
jgi:phosphatidate phosphatase APP1